MPDLPDCPFHAAPEDYPPEHHYATTIEDIPDEVLQEYHVEEGHHIPRPFMRREVSVLMLRFYDLAAHHRRTLGGPAGSNHLVRLYTRIADDLKTLKALIDEQRLMREVGTELSDLPTEPGDEPVVIDREEAEEAAEELEDEDDD